MCIRDSKNIESKTPEEYSAISETDRIGDRASEHGPPTRLYDVASTVNGYPSGNKFYLSSLEYNEDLPNQNEHGSHKNIKSTTSEEYGVASKNDLIVDRVAGAVPPTRSYGVSSTVNKYPSSNKVYLPNSEVNENIPNHNKPGSYKNLKLPTSEEYNSTSKVEQHGDRPSGQSPTTRTHDDSSSNHYRPSSNTFFLSV